MKYVIVFLIVAALMSGALSRPQDGPGNAPAPGEEGKEGQDRFFFGNHNLHLGNSNGGGGFPFPAFGGYPWGR